VCADVALQYANDESNAERGPSAKNEPLDFRKDAKVWYLYLEDAEREASEKAELWKTGLDSLLIFVSTQHPESSMRISSYRSAGRFIRWDRIFLLTGRQERSPGRL
jgi:hypothetical protein